MVLGLNTATQYKECFISEQREPIVVLHNLLQAGVFSSYVMYVGKDEVRIAGNEFAKVSVNQNSVSLDAPGIRRSERVSDLFKQVESALNSLPIKDWTAYGYIGFDAVRFYSSYSKVIEQAPLCFFVPETEIRFTAEGIYVKSLQSLAEIQRLILLNGQLPDYESASLAANFTDREDYQHNIETLIEAIREGDLHKAIISRPFKFTGDLDVLGTYTVGAKVNNAARSYCVNIGDIRAVGFSPETLMEVDESGFVVTNPLAATRPRGDSLEEDARLSDELFTDAKEVKEHALSIWLAQSEMSQLCLPETVQILNFMEVRKYRCVQHLSSRVGGLLKPGNTLWDALKVLFPGITVSGINKQQALEWIDRLESEPRGIYAGGIGWVDSNGLADLAIAIRSVYQYGDCICLNAGAGIVAESISQNEYIESVNKMNTMLTNLVLKP